jgi:hypothetical protein
MPAPVQAGRRLLGALLLVGSSQAAAGAESDRQAALARLFRAERIEAGWLAPDFLTAVPLARVQELVGELKRRHGALRSVAERDGRLVAVLDGAEVPARLSLDGEGRIAVLLLEPPVDVSRGLDEQVAAIAGLPGQTSVLVATDGQPVAMHEPDALLAVGSAGKLPILKAVDQAVRAGRLAWDQVVPLDPAWRSLPGGILQDWPDGTPVTLATLAGLMISVSDNTATDALLDLAGRSAVEQLAPRNVPFPSTREMFVLKSGSAAALRAAWRRSDSSGRRELLRSIADRPLPAAEELHTEPTLEVEWFFTARELCSLLEETADLAPFRIQPGPADPARWRQVAFKGGSEPGVLNLSTLLEDDEGRRHCVVANWNGETGLQPERLLGPYRAILHALARS